MTKNFHDLLFEPFLLGEIELKNRIVMAPMTRRRAKPPLLSPDDLIALYYRQRAGAGLIITEGSQISPQGYGYLGSPGCYSKEQISGWKKVTKAVHEAGGKIFLQLWHVGAYSHPLLQPDGMQPLSASPFKPAGEVMTPEGRRPYQTAREMTEEEIFQTINDFKKAAIHALEAGFDGVEIHAAHAYLIDQFIMDCINKRTDEFGGPVENRARFLLLIVEEILQHLPPSRVGVRISPSGFRAGLKDSDSEKTYGYIARKLSDYRLAYLHISEFFSPEERLNHPERSIVPFYRKQFRGTLISCGGHSLESCTGMLEKGHADLFAFGSLFISNPDLVNRLKKHYPLTKPDPSTYYYGGRRGYVDYPEWNADDTAKNDS